MEAFAILCKINGESKLKEEMSGIKVSINAETNHSMKQLFQPGLRKALSVGIFLTLFNECVFFFDIANGPLLMFFIMGFTAAFCVSMGPIPWIMIPEIFPNHLRARAVGLTTMFLWGGNWAIGQFTPMLLNGLGSAYTFWIFAVMNVICFTFVMTIVPETKSKSLEEIEQFWKPKNKKQSA